MEVSFSGKTKEDFRKYNDFIRRKKKSDGHKYQKYELDGIYKSLRKNISKGLKDTKEHKDSIFPKEFEYSNDQYKMYVDKKSHHIVFYKVITPKNGTPYIKIDKLVHSNDLKKELNRKGIKPIKDSDSSLLDDLEEVYNEDKVNQKEEQEDKGKEEEVYDEETGKKVKRIVYTGPKGGRFYKSDNGEKVYIDEQRIFKSLSSLLLESKMISLNQYIK